MTIKDSISLNFINRQRFTNQAIGRTHSVQWLFMCDQPSCLHYEYDDEQPFNSQREDNSSVHPSPVPVSSPSILHLAPGGKKELYTVSVEKVILSVYIWM